MFRPAPPSCPVLDSLCNTRCSLPTAMSINVMSYQECVQVVNLTMCGFASRPELLDDNMRGKRGIRKGERGGG